MIKKLVQKYSDMPIQIKASLWFTICAFMQKGISFITTPIFTRLLTTVEYGKYSVFNSWYGVISVLVTLNIYAGVYTRGLVNYEEERKDYVSAFQGLCITLVLIWGVIYLVFRDFFNEITGLTTIQMLAMIMMIWLSAVFNLWAAEQRVDCNYRPLVIVTIFVALFKPLLGIFLVLNAEDKVTARIFGILFVEIIAYTGMFISQIKNKNSIFNKRFWEYALKFNIPLIPHYFALTILDSADRIMIGYMVGEDAAGKYNLAYQISLIMTLFNSALKQTIEPWLFKKIKEKKISDISRVAYPTFLLIAVLNILLIAFAPEIISIFAPDEYRDAINIVPSIAMSAYFMFAYPFFAVFEFYYSKTNFIAISTVIGACLNIVLNYVGINMFGYLAAGYTTLICYIFFAVGHYLCMLHICRVYLNNEKPYSTKILLLLSLVFLGVGFLFLVTYKYTYVRYGFIFIMGLFIILKRRKIFNYLTQLIKLRK